MPFSVCSLPLDVVTKEAERLYVVWANSMGWMDPKHGEDLPPWVNLGMVEQEAWREVAKYGIAQRAG